MHVHGWLRTMCNFLFVHALNVRVWVACVFRSILRYTVPYFFLFCVFSNIHKCVITERCTGYVVYRVKFYSMLPLIPRVCEVHVH